MGALERATVAPLDGVHQAAKLADVMAVTGLDIHDAHVAAIADVAACPILTLRSDKWREPARALEQTLHVIEISDPD
ncbi:MAG TPA: hypothetical protein VFV66_35320 [Nonomuraea sp.]|nr:hypothetical protein [Nonomuraea sp.]